MWQTAITTKKSRLGIRLSVLCRCEDREKMTELILRHTTTIGMREYDCRRYTLERREEMVTTPYGSVRRKISAGYDVTRTKYEYEDLACIAREKDLTLPKIKRFLKER